MSAHLSVRPLINWYQKLNFVVFSRHLIQKYLQMLPRRPAFWEHQIKDSYNLFSGVREYCWRSMHVIPSAAARPVKFHCSGSSYLLRGISETSRFFFLHLHPIWIVSTSGLKFVLLFQGISNISTPCLISGFRHYAR